MREVTFFTAWRDNTALRSVAEGKAELAIELSNAEEHLPRLPHESEMKDKKGRKAAKSLGYHLGSYAGFHPPHVALLGANFWLVGRYILMCAPEIDSADDYIFEGWQVNRFLDAEEAVEAFARLASSAPLVSRLVSHYCSCSHQWDMHHHGSQGDQDDERDDDQLKDTSCSVDDCPCGHYSRQVEIGLFQT